MNEGLDDFDLATYRGDSVNLIAGVGQSFFSYDSTLISFSTAGLAGIDGIDDDFNSDNYRIDSSSGVYYPNNYVDDDADGRKLVYFFVNPGTGYSNIFWSNTGAAQYIDGNPNNHDTLNLLLGDVSSAYAYLDVNGAFSLKVVKFDKALYESTGEFSVLESIEGRDLVADIGYIQDNAGVASLSDTTTGNEYTFDFLTYDYAIFLQNMQSTPLLFKLTAETPTGTGIYINPVDDSDTNLVKVLANDIILDNDGNYIAKQFEVIGKK
ncbi:MAG: hypothetical protein H6767_04185 [Candidatus Peribacteria bacterium]|nr:MAG: hypothetical protein H6767_04185 [Candidatus Peribacteria bacterium]